MPVLSHRVGKEDFLLACLLLLLLLLLAKMCVSPWTLSRVVKSRQGKPSSVVKI